jgi:hypothetical protein
MTGNGEKTMVQNLISLTITPEQFAAIDQAIGALETQLQGFAALSIDARRNTAKMGPKSEAFCRQAVNALKLYPQIIPPSVGLDQAQADLDTLDQLRPLFQRLHRLSRRSADTELALGSDIMAVSLNGYRMLKALGRSQGLESLRRELGEQRFTKSTRPPQDEEVPAAA